MKTQRCREFKILGQAFRKYLARFSSLNIAITSPKMMQALFPGYRISADIRVVSESVRVRVGGSVEGRGRGVSWQESRNQFSQSVLCRPRDSDIIRNSNCQVTNRSLLLPIVEQDSSAAFLLPAGFRNLIVWNCYNCFFHVPSTAFTQTYTDYFWF